jgi:very-short-patch-repair endonuclease
MDEYEPHLKPYARNLRTHQTEAETKLWLHLRRDQLGVRFYRQRPLGQYILDFYSPKAKLVIELDGSQHTDDPGQRQADRMRDAWLMSQGLGVLRFDDRQVLTETEAVLEVIFSVVRKATGDEIPPIPPFAKGGEPQTHDEGPHTLQQGGEPQACIEGSLPFVKPPFGDKGGQEGFSGAPSTTGHRK